MLSFAKDITILHLSHLELTKISLKVEDYTPHPVGSAIYVKLGGILAKIRAVRQLVLALRLVPKFLS